MATKPLKEEKPKDARIKPIDQSQLVDFEQFVPKFQAMQIKTNEGMTLLPSSVDARSQFDTNDQRCSNQESGQKSEKAQNDHNRLENTGTTPSLPGFSSSFLKYKNDKRADKVGRERKYVCQEEESADRKAMNPPQKLIDDFIQYEDNYQIKREFMNQKEQLLQCIQNPQKKGEIITVQAYNCQTSCADPDLSVDQMVKGGLRPENLVVHYETCFKEKTSEIQKKGNRQTKKETDEVKFKKPISTVKFQTNEEQRAVMAGEQVSVIGFWRRDEETCDFYCYHYFYMQNLHKVENLQKQKVLFEGQDGIIFLIYRCSASKWQLRILNLDHHDKFLNKPFPAHDHISSDAIKEEFLLEDQDDVLKELIQNSYLKLFKRRSESNKDSNQSYKDDYFLLLQRKDQYDHDHYTIFQIDSKGAKRFKEFEAQHTLFVRYDQMKNVIVFLKYKGRQGNLVELHLDDAERIKEVAFKVFASSIQEGSNIDLASRIAKPIIAKTSLFDEFKAQKETTLDFQQDLRIIQKVKLHCDDDRLTLWGQTKTYENVVITLQKLDRFKMIPIYKFNGDLVSFQIGPNLWLKEILQDSSSKTDKSATKFRSNYYNISEKDNKSSQPIADESKAQTLNQSQIDRTQFDKLDQVRTYILAPQENLDSYINPNEVIELPNTESDNAIREKKFSFFEVHKTLTPQSSWVVDYPIFAFKSISPDNKEIVIMHLARKIPQRSIHLGNWELLSFVDGKFHFEDTRKQIVMLVKNRTTQQTKLMAIFIDPWKDVDYKLPFDQPENIFEVKNCEFQLPISNQTSCLSLGLRIKRIYMLGYSKQGHFESKGNHQALVCQLDNSIHVISLRGQSKQMTACQNIVPQFMLQDQLGRVFIAEKDQNKTQIYKLTLDQSSKTFNILKQKIFEINCEIAAISSDNCFEALEQNKSKIFVLCCDGNMLHLQQETTQSEFKLINSFDFSGQVLTDQYWNHFYLDDGSVAQGKNIHLSNNRTQKLQQKESYEWIKLESNQSKIDSQQIRGTQAMISLVKDKFCGDQNIIYIRPAFKSRELFMFANNERRIEDEQIHKMLFIHEDKILIQFSNIAKTDQEGRIIQKAGTNKINYIELKSYALQGQTMKSPDEKKLQRYKTIIIQAGGEIIPISQDIQRILQKKIVGDSEPQSDGSIIFSSLDENRNLVVYRVRRLDSVEIEFEQEDFLNVVKDQLQKSKTFSEWAKNIEKEGREQKEMIENNRNLNSSIQQLVQSDDQSPSKAFDFLNDRDKLIAMFRGPYTRFRESLFISSAKMIIMIASIRSCLYDNNSTDYEIEIETIPTPNREWTIKLVLVKCQNKDINDYILFRLINQDHLCYRHADEQHLNVIQLSDNRVGIQKIDLSHIYGTDEELKMLTTFDDVDNGSFLRCRLSEKNWIQKGQKSVLDIVNVVIGNTSYLYGLFGKMEEGSLHHLDQVDTFQNSGRFYSTGLPSQIVKKLGERKHFTEKYFANQQGSLYCIKRKHRKFYEIQGTDQFRFSVYNRYSNITQRTYSFHDVLRLKYIAQYLIQGKAFIIDDDTLTGVYQGHSIFSIFSEQTGLYRQILDQLNSGGYQEFTEGFNKAIKERTLQKIHLILNTPTLRNIYQTNETLHKKGGKEFKTSCQRSLYYKQTQIRDLLLQICFHLDEFDITEFVTTQEDMQRLIDTQNNMVLKAFSNHWSKYSKKLDEISELKVSLWNVKNWKGQRILVNSQDITKAQIEQIMKDNKHDSKHLGNRIVSLFKRV